MKVIHNKYLQLVVIPLIIFLLALLILLLTPKAVALVEGKLLYSGNELANKNSQLGVENFQPVKQQIEIYDLGNPAPSFASEAVMAQDVESGKVLFSKNIEKSLRPASTTKIMTALVASEHFKSSDVLTVFPEALVGGSTMGLVAGEKISFRSLLYGMMLNSGNDAAFTIAMNYPGGMGGFVVAMNKKAIELELKSTHFTNPAGFDAAGHYSSAADLAKIATKALENTQLARVVATKETLVSGKATGKSHTLKNLNVLLQEEGVMGIKTGYTELAGENFVGLVERNGHKVLTVVLASPDRFGETKSLMDWVFKNFEWRDAPVLAQ